MPPKMIKRVVAGIEYSIEGAVLIASTADRDASGLPNLNRGVFLYRSNKGPFFVVHQEDQPIERAWLVPLNRAAALRLYRSLPVHQRDERRAFRNLWAQAE
jgi:hypothetical protein